MNTKGQYDNRSLINSTKQRFREVIALLLLMPLAAWAGGVVTNCTEADLRAAIAGGGIVTFACDGTITVANTITNENSTTLDGTGHQVTISGGHAVRVFYVTTNASLTLIHISVEGGMAEPSSTGFGGGVVNEGGVLNLLGSSFVTNHAASGGAILNQGGVVTATDCLFSGNLAQVWLYSSYGGLASGGAILNLSGSVTLRNCVFAGNRACGMPAAPPEYPAPSGSGGAIENLGTLDVIGCTFLQNAAQGGKGWSAVPEPWQITAGCPGGSSDGGAIHSTGPLAVAGSTFVSNTVTGGDGGNGATGFTPPLSAGWPGTPGGNGGSAVGGALCATSSGFVVNSTFAHNTAVGGQGGAGGNGGDSDRSGLPGGDGGAGGNSGDAFGGVWGDILLTNSTLAFNSAYVTSGGLGGLGGQGMGSGTDGLPGPSGAGGQACGGLALGTCVNTLLASNSPGGNCSGVVDTGHDLSSDGTCAFTGAGMNNTEPKLGPLADNGGPTLTMALLPGSPAIDAGDTSLAPATDQRGFPRPAGLAADIGAFEYGSVMPAITISLSGVTNLTILGTGNANQSCRLLSSPDLTSWVPIATNQIGGDGTVLFDDTCGPGSTCGFYRLVMP